jgi:hypothetical protein
MNRKYLISDILVALAAIAASSVRGAEKVAQEAPPAEQVSILKLVWDIVKWPLLIIIILAIVIFIVVKIILAILKWLKLKDNEMQKMMLMKIQLARSQHKFKYASHMLRWKKNSPIFLFYKNAKNEIMKEFFGVYMGDFTDNENVLWINFANKPLHFLLWFVPRVETIMCPQNSKINLVEVTDVAKQTYSTKPIDIVPVNVHFLNDEVLIETNHIDKMSDEFDMYIPILKDDTGKAIDVTHAVYQITENLILKKVQYDILNSYSSNIRKGMEMNVIMKSKQKLGDSEGQVE